MSAVQLERNTNIEASIATVRERIITQKNRRYIYRYIDVAVHSFDKDSEVIVLILPLDFAKQLKRLLPKFDAAVTDLLARKNKLLEVCPDIENDLRILSEVNQIMGEMTRKIITVVDIAELKKKEE
ncbi:MAG: hypothetical protein GXO26_04345 [Crenarchaeota archaeon]|nr:hypothetical protein [Thermoproteota archaeon]